MAKYTPDEVLMYTLEEDPNSENGIKGPRVVNELRTRLWLEDAEVLSEKLTSMGYEMRAYDFPNTMEMWMSADKDGIPYKFLALKEMIQNMANELEVDYKSFEGFSKILPDLTFHNTGDKPINKWGTTIDTLFSHYWTSHIQAILDLIEYDPEFWRFKQDGPHPVNGYDFPKAQGNMWVDKKGLPTDAAMKATKEFVKSYAHSLNVDYTTFEGFAEILPNLVGDLMSTTPINEWGTTLGGQMMCAYNNSCAQAILDLIEHDPEFWRFRESGPNPLRGYDFPMSPRFTWTEHGKPTDTARAALKVLTEKYAESIGVDFRTFEGFSFVLPMLNERNIQQEPINEWGTTLMGMLGAAYKGSPNNAVLELIAHDDDFWRFRESGTHPLRDYDFPMAARGIWTDEQGTPTDRARAAVKQLIEVIADEQGVDYRTFEGFKRLIHLLNVDTFDNKSISCWGTTLNGLIPVYECSPFAAVKDLIQHDPDFEIFREYGRYPLKAYDFDMSPHHTWIDKQGLPTRTARDATKIFIINTGQEQGVEYNTLDGFAKIRPLLTQQNFNYKPINEWDTTLKGMLASAYKGSPKTAVLDVIINDVEFLEIKENISNFYAV